MKSKRAAVAKSTTSTLTALRRERVELRAYCAQGVVQRDPRPIHMLEHGRVDPVDGALTVFVDQTGDDGHVRSVNKPAHFSGGDGVAKARKTVQISVVQNGQERANAPGR